MKLRAVHQFVASLVDRDAVGRHTLRVRDVLRGMGLDSDIYVQAAAGEVAGESRPFRTFEGGEGAGILYQASTGSPVAEFLLERDEPLIVNYHNVTPPRFVERWDRRVATELRVGLRQMAALGPRSRLGIAPSRFNETDLRRLGFGATAVAPVLFDPAELRAAVDEHALERLGAAGVGGGSDWLFVGRVVPHKGAHDLVRALAVYREVWDPAARLWLVGGEGPRRYVEAVRSLVEALGLEDAVTLTGSVSAGELAAHYESADVFVCVSEHEGFCIPLLEALHHGLPVVAFGAAAVPETLGDAGVVLGEKDPVTVAAAVRRVVEDGGLRERLAAAGVARLADFDLDTARARFGAVVSEALDRLEVLA